MVQSKQDILLQSPLGKKSQYDSQYDPGLLFPVERVSARFELGITEKLPFVGFDIWNHYEVSWLNEKGKPIAAIAEITYPCESPNMIESKSMKLYFNSLNNMKFKNKKILESVIQKDFSVVVGFPVVVKVTELTEIDEVKVFSRLEGICLDELDVECTQYTVHPDYLSTESVFVEEKFFSHLLKSNCLVTNQPDWASVQISYRGDKINREGLLKYLVSFRNHNEFHEPCIERIFVDIMRCCRPQALAVYGRYTRRGGLDINAYRGTKYIEAFENNTRLIRQ